MPLLSFSSVALVLGGFVLFTISIADPLERAQKEEFAFGVVLPDDALRRQGPLYTYVALHTGPPDLTTPQTPVDDTLTEGDGRFALRADASDGGVFYVLVRVEAASTLAVYCVARALPQVRPVDDGWEVAATGDEVPPLRIEVGPEDACSE
jgi:hypothetical protein